MDIKEKAKAYAEGKAQDAITTAIEEAYVAGYNDGYNDGFANRKKPDEPSKYKNVNYIDLDLPSGTKWATDYLRKANGEIELLDFFNAKAFNIPTQKQFQELIDNTEQLMTHRNGQLVTEFLSIKNGARFWLPNGCYKKNGFYDEDNYMFWLKEAFNSQKAIFALGPIIDSWDLIPSYSLPIVLVSKSDTGNEGWDHGVGSTDHLSRQIT